MQKMMETRRKRPVPAFVAAALVFAAMAVPPAHADDGEEKCPTDVRDQLELLGMTSVSPENVTVTALTGGEFTVDWDIPSAAPAGLVTGFCVEQTHEQGGTQTHCTFATVPPPTSTTVDNCVGPGDACYTGVHTFRVKLESGCTIDLPYSSGVSAQTMVNESEMPPPPATPSVDPPSQ